MKILHINSYYYGSTFYKGLFEKQTEMGMDLNVYVPIPKCSRESLFSYGEYTNISENHGKYDRVLFHMKHNKIYSDIINQYEIDSFDMIHAHSLFSNGYIALKLKEKYKIPYIVAVRSTDEKIFFKKMIHLRSLGIKILEQANAVIFLSETCRDRVLEKYIPDRLKQDFVNKIKVIPNGIDDFWLGNIGDVKSKPKKEELKLVYVGVINKNKNPVTTIKAIRILQERGYQIQFSVVGRIQDQNVYRDITKHPFVTYLGVKTKEDLINIYRRNDILVMPSKIETFGLVYAEAMSQGLPIIYTKGEGFDGQFDEGAVGYHVDCTDSYEIADRISDTFDDYEKLSRNGTRYCNRFNWVQIASNYKDIYSGTL